MPDTIFTCFDRVIPLELTTLADDLAVQVRRDNDGSNLEAAGERHRFWLPGQTLRVRFLDTPELAQRVLEIAGEWTRHARLNFQLVTDGPADIRVTFAEPGNWSAVGTDALVTEYFPPDGATMCLSEIRRADSSMRVERIVRHEFGHAIGLVHEHSSPAAGILWDKEAVYAELAGPPNHWDQETVDHNVFRRYGATTTEHTAFDPHSIMLYPLPARWTLDRRTFAENIVLSDTDKDFAARIYPGACLTPVGRRTCGSPGFDGRRAFLASACPRIRGRTAVRADEDTLEDLVAAAQAGDQRAWLELLARFDGMVHGVAGSFRLQDADVADVVQSTWLSAFEKLGALREPDRFGGWLRTIARNECKDACVRADRERPVEDVTAVEDPRPGPEALAVRAETALAVRTAVATLPHRNRILVERLFFAVPSDYASVAQETGIPVGGIGPTRARALVQLRTRMARSGYGPVPALAEAG